MPISTEVSQACCVKGEKGLLVLLITDGWFRHCTNITTTTLCCVLLLFGGCVSDAVLYLHSAKKRYGHWFPCLRVITPSSTLTSYAHSSLVVALLGRQVVILETRRWSAIEWLRYHWRKCGCHCTHTFVTPWKHHKTTPPYLHIAQVECFVRCVTGTFSTHSTVGTRAKTNFKIPRNLLQHLHPSIIPWLVQPTQFYDPPIT